MRNTIITFIPLASVYLVLRCAIRLEGKAYSTQISSESIPANTNDVFIVFTGSSEACDRRNNKRWNISSIRLQSTEKHPLYFQNAEGGLFCVSSTLSITLSS